MRRRLVLLAAVGALIAVVYVGSNLVQRERPTIERRPVVVPDLSDMARAGARTFALHCAGCHGPDAGGTQTGPTLVDPIYRSAHHADASFLLAIRNGVAAHHWRFGNMPPVPGLSADDTKSIIQYVREVQQANGVK